MAISALKAKLLKTANFSESELRKYIVNPRVLNYRACMPRGCNVIAAILDGKSQIEISRLYNLSEVAVWRSACAALDGLKAYREWEKRAVSASDRFPVPERDERYMHYLNLLRKMCSFKGCYNPNDWRPSR